MLLWKKNLRHFRFLSCRGLCTILRSEAGGQTDLEETNVDVTVNRAYKNNAHWLPQGQNSNFVAYYDAASLYPTSGKHHQQHKALSSAGKAGG